MQFKKCRGFVEVATVLGLTVSPIMASASGVDYDLSWTPPEPDPKGQAVDKEDEAKVTGPIIPYPIVAIDDLEDAMPYHAFLREHAALRNKVNDPKYREEEPARKEQKSFVAMGTERYNFRQNKKRAQFQYDAWGNACVVMKKARGNRVIKTTAGGHFLHVS